jgi:hypothetical protein
MSGMTSTAAAGWYPDPSDPTIEHWWDGSAYHGTRSAAGSAAVPPAPQPAQPAPAYAAAPYTAAVPLYVVSPKSRTVAVLLGFFLGGLGVDRFYLGNIGMGVAKLLLGWATAGIWPLIDWIIILAGAAHDGDGLPVTNWS